MPPFGPVLVSDARILAAYLISFGSYFVFAVGTFLWMKIDRPGAAIIGAVLMVAFRIVGAREAAGLDLFRHDHWAGSLSASNSLL